MHRGGRGGGRGRGGGDMGGYCALHNRKRLRADLVPWDRHAGQFRCSLRKMCHQVRDRVVRDRRGGANFNRTVRRDQPGTAVCRIHGRRRKMVQMREVAHGIWECREMARCRPVSGAPMRPLRERRVGVRSMRGGRGMVGRGFTPLGRGQRRTKQDRPARGGDHGGNSKYDYANAASWAPTGPGTGGGGGIGRDQRAAGARSGAVTRKVWCAMHGKNVLANQCDYMQDCCYVCIDASTCLSTPLEAPSVLIDRGCAELVCDKHKTLRSAGFVALNDKAIAFECLPGHTCFSTTLPHAAADGEQAVGVEEMQGADETEEAYAGSRAPDGFVQQPSARDAVSSFFV